MLVYGHTVTPEQIDAALARMKKGDFWASSIELELLRAGVPEWMAERSKRLPAAMRAADRIIQRERKDGNIIRQKTTWRWVGAADNQQEPTRMVGCETDEGLLITHPESETCAVCSKMAP